MKLNNNFSFNLKGFDKNAENIIPKDENIELSDKLLKRYVNKTCQIIEKIKEIGLPKQGEQLRLITTKAFNSIAIIKHIADRETIKSGKLVIFAINQYAARLLIDLKKEGKLNNTVLIVSSIRNPGIKAKCIAVELLKEHFKIIFITSHAKIAILETEKGNYYNIEGSGNFSYNARLEQYVIDNEKGLFGFSNQWIKEVERINKATFDEIKSFE
jgi:hypothetical protein